MPRGVFRRTTRPSICPIGPSIAYIPLTKGQYALIDSDDAEELSHWNWVAHWADNTKSFYAWRAASRHAGETKYVSMHRYLLGLKEWERGDHIHHRTLDNRRSQIRKATVGQNNTNQRVRRDNSSGFKGVSRDGSRWKAQIQLNGEKRHLGNFLLPEDAHAAYCQAATELHGQFAGLV